MASRLCTSWCSKDAGAWGQRLVEEPPKLGQGWDGGSSLPLPRMLQEHPHHLGCREDAPAPAMLRLPGMSPQCRRVVALGTSHHAGCSLLHAHALGLPVIFCPHGESVADPNRCGLPWGKAVVSAASSLSRLPPRLQHPPRHHMGREHGASCKTIFAILLLEGQLAFLNSRPRHCPRQKIKVLWEVSKPESHPPPVPGGRGSGCGLDGISGRELQPAPL